MSTFFRNSRNWSTFSPLKGSIWNALRKAKDAHIDHCTFLEVTPTFAPLLYGNLDPDLGYAKAQRISQLLPTAGILKIKEINTKSWIYCPYIEVLVNKPLDYTFIKELWNQVKVESWIVRYSKESYLFTKISKNKIN